jgi:hypothetical protein
MSQVGTEQLYPLGNDQRRTDGNGHSGRGETLATALGWFSIALGVAQLVAPDAVARLIGVRDDDRTCNTMRALGAREVSAGLGLLSVSQPAGWAWSRVAGDAMDLALLGKALAEPSSDRSRTAVATAAVLGVTALDVMCASELSRSRASATREAANRDAATREAIRQDAIRRGEVKRGAATRNDPSQIESARSEPIRPDMRG